MSERGELRETEFTDQPVVIADDGMVRFLANPIVRHLLDEATAGRKCDMNDLARVQAPDWAYRQFAQLIGYSVSGYSELSYVDDAAYARAEAAAEALRAPSPTTEAAAAKNEAGFLSSDREQQNCLAPASAPAGAPEPTPAALREWAVREAVAIWLFEERTRSSHVKTPWADRDEWVVRSFRADADRLLRRIADAMEGK